MVGALLLAAMGFFQARLSAQAPAAAAENVAVTMSVAVTDGSGAALAGATVTDSAGKLLSRADATGKMNVQCFEPCQLRVSATGFADKTVRLTAGMVIQLEPAANTQQVTVTAYRTPMAAGKPGDYPAAFRRKSGHHRRHHP